MVQRVSFSITTVLLSFSFGNIARDVVGNIAHNVPARVSPYYYPIILFSNVARDVLATLRRMVQRVSFPITIVSDHSSSVMKHTRNGRLKKEYRYLPYSDHVH